MERKNKRAAERKIGGLEPDDPTLTCNSVGNGSNSSNITGILDGVKGKSVYPKSPPPDVPI